MSATNRVPVKVISNRSDARAAFGPLLKASGLTPEQVGLGELFAEPDKTDNKEVSA